MESRREYDATDNSVRTDSNKLVCNAQRYSTIKIKNKRKEVCCICMENFKCSENVYRLDCKHLFHEGCLDEWICYKNECPTCRLCLPLE